MGKRSASCPFFRFGAYTVKNERSLALRLSTLFEKCLSARYISTENGGDYAIEREGDTVYIYLESSDGAEDWKNNLAFSVRRYQREGRTAFYAHGGFLRVFLSILPHLRAVIEDKGNTRFTVVGFSHGGALAVLLHEHILFCRPELSGRVLSYAFGAPRVLWGKVSKAQRERFRGLTRVKNTDDLITHLPPALFGFFHVGELFTVGTEGKYSGIDAHRPENVLTELRLHEQKYGSFFCRKRGVKEQMAKCTKKRSTNYSF